MVGSPPEETLEIGQLEIPDIGGRVDQFREKLALLLVLFGLTIALYAVLVAINVWLGQDASLLAQGLHEVLPAETGLLGAAIGHYFGTRAGR